MPTLIDSLIVSLSLDPKDFTKGQKQVADGLLRTRDEANKTSREIESSGKRAANYIASVKNEVVGLFLAFAGANGIKAFAGDMINTAASVGRLSDNIGASTEDISAWQAVVEKAGGSASDAQGAMKQMAMVLGDMSLGLRPANSGILQSFGINQDTAKSPLDMLLRIADASQHMNRLTFTDLASRLGLSDATIALLGQGRSAVEKQLAAEQKLYAIHKKDADAARDFTSAIAGLRFAIAGELYPVMTPLIKQFNDWVQTGDNGKVAAEGMTVALGAMAVAAALPYAPLIAIGAAVAFIIEKLGGAKMAFAEFSTGLTLVTEWWDAVKNHDWVRASHLQHQYLANATNSTIAGVTPMTVGGNSLERLTASASGYLKGGRPGARSGGRHVALAGNNPGGINDGAFAQSQAGYVGSNGRYAAFDTLEHGEQAQTALLMRYIGRGYDTPAKIAARWAPAADGNHPAAYAAQIARMMGIGVNTHLTMADARRFAMAQGTAENAAYRASGGAVSIGTINVTAPPGSDPKAFGAAVGRGIHNRLRGLQADGPFN